MYDDVVGRSRRPLRRDHFHYRKDNEAGGHREHAEHSSAVRNVSTKLLTSLTSYDPTPPGGALRVRLTASETLWKG